MRAIDADEVFKAVYDMACQNVLIPGCEDYAHGLREAANYIENAPTLDVAPAKYGEWILRHVGAGHYWECSVCNKNPCIYVTKDTKFCPNCGAKMDAGQEDENNGENMDG